jgi:hypothetical protein
MVTHTIQGESSGVKSLHDDAMLGFGRDLAAPREIPGVFSLMNFD